MGATTAAEVLLEAAEPMAFYLVRHCTELGLMLAAGKWPEEHNLGSLLKAVPAGHQVHGPGEDARRFRSFLQDIVRADASGQAGRYPFLTSGLPAFDGVCHLSRDNLALFLSDTWFFLRLPFDTAA